MLRPTRRSGKKLVLLALVVVAVIGIVTAGVALGPRLLAQRGKAATKGQPTAGQAQADKATEKEGKEKEAAVVALGDFLVNLRSQTGLRYLRTEVSVSLSGLGKEGKGGGHGEGAAKKSVLTEGEVAVARDRVVAVLSASTFEQLRTPEGRTGLKQQLQANLQQALSKYQVTEVLLTSFVMQ